MKIFVKIKNSKKLLQVLWKDDELVKQKEENLGAST